MPNIRKENIDDMMLGCQDLQFFKSLCGKDTKAVNVQADGCYNNALYSGVGKTQFQPGTQAIYVVAENETNKKQIKMFKLNQSSVRSECMVQALSASTLGSALPILIWLAILAMKKNGQNLAFQNGLVLGLK